MVCSGSARRRVRTAGAAALVCAAAFAPAGADVIFVRAGATGAGTGASWADAFTEVQAGLAGAEPGDEIWVAAGTYRPAPGPGDRAVSFFLRDGVALYGGFAGNETSRSQRDFAAHPTILSGDLAGDDGDGFANSRDNCYQVVVALNVDATAVLDGFTITGGHADGPGFGALPESKDQGSGLNIYYSSPRVLNCTFTRNWSGNHGAVNDHGDTTLIMNCVFRGNYAAGFGAGLYIHHHSETSALECAFIDNTTPNEGGGAYTRSMHGATIERCVFLGNHANLGAGLYNAPGSETSLDECTFQDNEAGLGGGGVYSSQASPMLGACVFTSNRAALGVQGGSG